MIDGKKNDAGKADWSILQLDVLEPLIRVLEFGETKYDRDNFKKVIPQRRYWSALLRHLSDYRAGQAVDSETGHSHLGHAMACLYFLLWFEKYAGFEPSKLSEPLTKPEPSLQEQKQALKELRRLAIGAGSDTRPELPHALAEIERQSLELERIAELQQETQRLFPEAYGPGQAPSSMTPLPRPSGSDDHEDK